MICNRNDCTKPAAENAFICEDHMDSLLPNTPYDCSCDDEMCNNCLEFQRHGHHIFDQQEGEGIGDQFTVEPYFSKGQMT